MMEWLKIYICKYLFMELESFGIVDDDFVVVVVVEEVPKLSSSFLFLVNISEVSGEEEEVEVKVQS